MVLKKKRSLVGLPKTVRDEINSTPNYFEKNNGLYNTHIVEVNPNYNDTDAETVTQGLHNSFIIMGRDRPRGIDSGYGGVGATQCGTIDIVAGLGGAIAKQVDEISQLEDFALLLVLEPVSYTHLTLPTILLV